MGLLVNNSTLKNAYLNKQETKNKPNLVDTTERKEKRKLIEALKKDIIKLNGLLSPWKRGEVIPREQLDTIEGLISFHADIIYMAMYDGSRIDARKANTLSNMIYKNMEMKLIAKKIELTNQLMELEAKTLDVEYEEI